MCQNYKEVRIKGGRKLFVPCGHCDACLQDKADKRAIRISNHYADDGNMEMAMCTLTYDDKFIPYIKKSDIEVALHARYIDTHQVDSSVDYSDGEFKENEIELPVYRDYDMRWCNISRKDVFNYHPSLIKFSKKGLLACKPQSVCVDSEFKSIDNVVCEVPNHFSLDSLPTLHHYPDRISVAYYPDVQKFFKRVRQNLFRNGYTFPISYYSCSEYGSKFSRAHFHVLFFYPKGYFYEIKCAVTQSWPYDYRLSKRSDFRKAIHPSSYVASYVNCVSNVPSILQKSSFRQKHSYSFRFGTNKRHLTLPKVSESFRRNDFLIYNEKVVDGTLISTPSVLPSYVVSRYAPKCKGYCRLDYDERFDIAKKPEKLFGFYKRLEYNSPIECHRDMVMLRNKQKEWLQAGLSIDDFALFWSRAWSLRASKVLMLAHHEFDTPKRLFQYYYNIKEFYDGSIDHEALQENMFNLPKDYAYEIDPNKFDDVLSAHWRSFQRYHYYKKCKHVNNIAFNDQL